MMVFIKIMANKNLPSSANSHYIWHNLASEKSHSLKLDLFKIYSIN